MSRLSIFAVGLLVGALVGLTIGINIGKERPWAMNPFQASIEQPLADQG